MKMEIINEVMDRSAFGEMLVRIGEKISRQGQITVNEKEINFPSELSVKCKYSRKRNKKGGGDYFKFGLKCRWDEESSSVASHREVKEVAKKPKRPGNLKANKKSLEKSWNIIMISLKNGRLPTPAMIHEYDELNREFAALARPEYKKEMDIYMKTSEEFTLAADSGDIDQTRRLARRLARQKSDCHDMYM